MSNRDTSLDPKILESAKCEFLENGFINASLKRIAQNAGVTTGAIYRRYDGKAALFGAVVQPALEMFDDLMQRSFSINEQRKNENRMRDSWSQSLETLQAAFKLIYSKKDSVKILLAKSEGTIYSNYMHDFIEKNFTTSYQFMVELERKGMCKLKLSYMEYHILITSFWMTFVEVIIHDFTLDAALVFAEKINVFFAWDKLIEL